MSRAALLSPEGFIHQLPMNCQSAMLMTESNWSRYMRAMMKSPHIPSNRQMGQPCDYLR